MHRVIKSKNPKILVSTIGSFRYDFLLGWWQKSCTMSLAPIVVFKQQFCTERTLVPQLNYTAEINTCLHALLPSRLHLFFDIVKTLQGVVVIYNGEKQTTIAN